MMKDERQMFNVQIPKLPQSLASPSIFRVIRAFRGSQPAVQTFRPKPWVPIPFLFIPIHFLSHFYAISISFLNSAWIKRTAISRAISQSGGQNKKTTNGAPPRKARSQRTPAGLGLPRKIAKNAREEYYEDSPTELCVLCALLRLSASARRLLEPYCRPTTILLASYYDPTLVLPARTPKKTGEIREFEAVKKIRRPQKEVRCQRTEVRIQITPTRTSDL